MGLIAGVIAAGVIGAGATAYASSEASAAQSDANKANQDINNATNALNYQMFLQSRGSQGNALLPMYFGEGTEGGLANKAFQTWLASQASLGSPTDQLAGYQSIVQGVTPAMDAGDALVNQLFSGDLERQQQANIAPVMAARGAVAKAQKGSILEGLMARLNAISADRARSGYSGGGSALQKNLLTGATIPMLQEAANVGAQADLANATDTAAIKNNAIATRLGNLTLPLSQAANRIQLKNLPTAAVGDSFAKSLQPFDFFRIGPQAFTNQRGPLVTPVPSTGQIVGQGVGSTASAMGNFFAQKYLANQMNPGVSASRGTYPSMSQNDAMMAEYYGLGT